MKTRFLISLLVLLAPAAAAQTPDPAWVHADTATKKVTFDLIAGMPGVNGGLNFNGAATGALTFVAPVGWEVTFAYSNQDKSLTHSAEVITPRNPLPIQAVDPAAPGAGSKEPLLGLAASDPGERFSFKATTAGAYIVYCGVPGHGMAGMWVRLRIDGSAKTPSVIATPATGH